METKKRISFDDDFKYVTTHFLLGCVGIAIILSACILVEWLFLTPADIDATVAYAVKAVVRSAIAAGCLAGIIQFVNLITRGDWLGKIEENAYACAAVTSLLIAAGAYIIANN